MRPDQHEEGIFDEISLDPSLSKVTKAVEALFNANLHVTFEKALYRCVDLIVGQRT